MDLSPYICFYNMNIKSFCNLKYMQWWTTTLEQLQVLYNFVSKKEFHLKYYGWMKFFSVVLNESVIWFYNKHVFCLVRFVGIIYRYFFANFRKCTVVCRLVFIVSWNNQRLKSYKSLIVKYSLSLILAYFKRVQMRYALKRVTSAKIKLYNLYFDTFIVIYLSDN